MPTVSVVACAAFVAAACVFGVMARLSSGEAATPVVQPHRERDRAPVTVPRIREVASPAGRPVRRNPFAFVEPTAVATEKHTARDREPSPTAGSVPAAFPRFVLAGIAETRSNGGLTRTAVMTIDERELVFITTGQDVGGGVIVEEIGTDSVVLRNPVTHVRQTLRLAFPGQ